MFHGRLYFPNHFLKSLAEFISAVVPNLFRTRDRFRGRQFFYDRGWGRTVRAVMRAMGSDGERQMKLHSLAQPLISCGAVQFLMGRTLEAV